MNITYLKKQLVNGWSEPKTKQITMLFCVNIITLPIGLIVSVILSRYLGPVGYGNYQFLDDIFNFVVIVFGLGFLYATNRAIVLSNNKDKVKEYYGTALIILLGIYLIISVCLVVFSLFDPNLKEKHLNSILFFSIPFGWVYLITSYCEILFQADNRISLLALSRLLPRIGLLIGAISISYYFGYVLNDRLVIAWGAYLLFQILAGAWVLYKLNVSFKNIKNNIKEIWEFNKSYGFLVYTGNAFSVGVAYLTGVLISYFGRDNSGVGFFTLAFSLSSPMLFIPNTIATTNFKEFASSKSIPSKLTKITLMLTLSSLIMLWLLVPPFVNYFYGEKFKGVIYLNFVISIAATCYGMADYYNKFLNAHGKGKSLRTTALVVGVVVLVSNLIMIPLYGAKGAAITRMVGGAVYLICTFYFYKIYVNDMNTLKSEY